MPIAANPVTAIVYSESATATAVMARTAELLLARGARCSGFLQRDEPRNDRPKCDMVLEDLSRRRQVPISEDRGPLARGCRLDESQLVAAVAATRDEIEHGDADVLFINKFGKAEAEGRGFRPLIADAMEKGVAVIIAVSWRNIESWRAFAGDLAVEQAADALAAVSDDTTLLDQLAFSFAAATTSDADCCGDTVTRCP